MSAKDLYGNADYGSRWNILSEAGEASDRATELTHPLYRYPASMSPKLARSLILSLTQKGELVLDPFCGGGTTAVEALASGRMALCSDLNALACFVTRAKASPTRQASIRVLEHWLRIVEAKQYWLGRATPIPLITREGRRYAPRTHGELLDLRNFALSIGDPAGRRLALLIVLKAGQLCFDCRKLPPSPGVLARAFSAAANRALKAMRSYSLACSESQPSSGERMLRVFQCDAATLPKKLTNLRRPISLVLTSPPYPGVHALYHRWQLFGRREINLPYSLLGLNDGQYESHYTMGSRKQFHNASYFERIRSIYRELRFAIGQRALIAQVIGFSDPMNQLPYFREAMREAGYEEIEVRAGRAVAVRAVPNRRWYAAFAPRQHAATEYVFVHKPRSCPRGKVLARL